jgi:putative DNA primase/helicase
MTATDPVLPAELLPLPQWVCWRFEERDGKPTKVPVNPRTGQRASVNDPATWAPFAQAWGSPHNTGTVGFVFTGADPYCGIDLDGCRDPETGTIKPWAQAIIDRFGSYTEISQSGRGIHILVRGKLPGPGRRKRLPEVGGEIEMYDQGRYFVLTGRPIDEGVLPW